MKNTVAVALIVLALVVGYVAGFITPKQTIAPGATVTSGVVGTTTVTVTKTTTIMSMTTITAPGTVQLSGEIPIGALLPLSGDLSTYGAMCKEALLLAVNDVNEWLAALGKPWRLKAIIEDTAVNPDVALNKLMSLYAQGVRVVIGPMASSEVAKIKSYADENHILVISQSSTAISLAIPGDYIYRYTAPDSYQGKAIANIMWKRGIRFVVPIWRGDTWGDGLTNAVKEEFTKLCSNSSAPCGWDDGIRYDPKATEFSTEVATLANKVQSYVDKYGKDKVGVLAISFEEVAAIMAEALKYPILSEVRWQGSDGTYGTTKLLEPALAEFAAKVEFWNTMTAVGESPLKERVREHIREVLGQDPIPYAYFTYDIVVTVALAIDHVGKYDAAAIKDALPQILKYYIGASGYFTLDENGDRATADYMIGAVVKTPEGKYEWRDIGIYTASGELTLTS